MQLKRSLESLLYINPRAKTNDIDCELSKLLLNDPSRWYQKVNENFFDNESQKYHNYFQAIESNPLTSSQIKAVISNEKNNLVLAGAGSGKTSVVIARIGYLIKSNKAKEDEILVLVFNKDAATEIKERVKDKLGCDVAINTFHAYGNKILQSANALKQAPCSFTDNEAIFKKFIERMFVQLLQSSKKLFMLFKKYFLSHFISSKSLFEFNSKHEYEEYIQSHELITLNGDVVKSYEELMISNYLTLSGIKHEYEKDYEYDTASAEYRQYKPDFYLSDYGIYIEHFGIDRDGKTASFIDATKYNEERDWKVALHQNNNTKLIQTFSYERQEGVLLENLEQKLLDHGVAIASMKFEKVLETFNKNHVISNFTNLLIAFLNHYKSNDLTIDRVDKKINKDNRRHKLFLEIFDLFVSYYEQYKIQNRCIDFHDMILQASQQLQQGNYPTKYKYIIIDEFQDIAIARSNLALLTGEQVANSVITVVGDDWQSINRFAGSDVGIIKNFAKYYGDTYTVLLENTFRFDDNICKIATHFISKNKTQITKDIVPIKQSKKPSISIFWYEDYKEYLDELFRATIESNSHLHDKSLMLLGRNKFSLPQNIKESALKYKAAFSKGISELSVHKSKGLEADIVLLFGLKQHILGFPTLINDDPILDIVLSSEEEIDHAEERRLFYVALTRAKEHIVLVANKNQPSQFVVELLKDFPNDITHLNEQNNLTFAKCPECVRGNLIIRKNANSSFIGCSRFPKCEYTLHSNYICSKCNKGAMFKSENSYRCSYPKCDHHQNSCPECGEILVNKNGKYGAFVGCSGYGVNKCTYTRKI